jgi:hypothetical protein
LGHPLIIPPEGKKYNSAAFPVKLNHQEEEDKPQGRKSGIHAVLSLLFPSLTYSASRLKIPVNFSCEFFYSVVYS